MSTPNWNDIDKFDVRIRKVGKNQTKNSQKQDDKLHLKLCTGLINSNENTQILIFYRMLTTKYLPAPPALQALQALPESFLDL